MIKKTHPFRTVLFATLMCGVSTTALFAQGPGGGPPPGGGPGQHHGPPPSPLFDALDTNHDGVISADEMTSAPASLKAMLKTGETALTREDLRPTRPASAPAGSQPAASGSPASADAGASPAASPAAMSGGPGAHPHHGPPPSPLFDALDTNHDGVISADEMTSAPASLKAMLKTGETALTREDVRPAHPPQGQPKAAPGA